MVEELDVAQYGAEPTLKRAYTWGLDLSGSFSGAGGIGGLLEIQNYADALTGDAGTYLTVYDGNGNLTGLISTATKGLVAEHVPSRSRATPRSLALYTEREARAYDPFGSMLRETGRPIAFEQPFRFATKTYDHETELCNFGFRHYHTSLGRFINRDPIEERGGWALFKGLNYGLRNPFYGNRSLNATNFLAEYGSRQDEGLKNTSLAHSTETIGTGQPKNSQAKWERDLNTKLYSANSSATGHVGQGGSSGIEWHTPDRSVRSSDPWNRDLNLYTYSGNDPINNYDSLGLLISYTDTTDKKGIIHRDFTFTATLVNKAGVSKSDAQAAIKDIKNGIESAMSGKSDKMVWTMKADIKLGDAKSIRTGDHQINLVGEIKKLDKGQIVAGYTNEIGGNEMTLSTNSLGKGRGIFSKSGAHEFGHLAGLKHAAPNSNDSRFTGGFRDKNTPLKSNEKGLDATNPIGLPTTNPMRYDSPGVHQGGKFTSEQINSIDLEQINQGL